nr:nucleotide-binding alpha-beta plait domain-containing protein [Tanacetum cinerariifolium]
MTKELRLKREAAEAAFEVSKEKDHTVMRLKEMKFSLSARKICLRTTHSLSKSKKRPFEPNITCTGTSEVTPERRNYRGFVNNMGMSLMFSFLTGDLNWAAKVGISSLSDAKVLKPALVLVDSCAHEPDLALSLVGKLKEFGPLPNLNKILVEEGFLDITIRYLGGLWVILQFSLKISKDNFMLHVGV